MHPFVVAVLAVFVAQVGWLGSHDIADRAAGCGWRAPLEVEVVDGFRPPSNHFSAGNRGFEYGTVGGEPVAAVAAGLVTFVGPVGGLLYVVITHDDSLRSTYGPLQSTSTLRGQHHRQGDSIGLAAPGFHLTARAGDRYVDPQPLLDGLCGRPRLISPNVKSGMSQMDQASLIGVRYRQPRYRIGGADCDPSLGRDFPVRERSCDGGFSPTR